MPISECVECDKPAFRFWGSVALCKLHFADHAIDDPLAHRCSQCGDVQPLNVMWRGDKPCGKCQELDQ